MTTDGADVPANFAAWLLASGQPTQPAICQGEQRLTYAQLHERVRAVAGFVQQWHAGNLASRPVVLLVGESSIAQVAAYLGVIYAGAIPAPIAVQGPGVLAAIAAETGARLALISPDARERVRDWPGALVPVEDAQGPRLEEAVAVPCDEVAALMYTSGSTGRSRGVMVSTRNLWANTRAILAAVPLAEDDAALLTLPLYYCYGASVLHTHLRAGASVNLTTTPFPDALVAELVATGATGLPAVPSLIHMLMMRSQLATVELPRLRYVMVSGGKLAERAVRDLQSALPGVQLYVRYGVTELTAAASVLPPELLDTKLGSIGRGLPGAALHVERDDGTPIEPGSGEVGEIVARGAHVTLGYFGDPDETSRAFRGGAFYTGDLATVDRDGCITIVGRAKEFVKTGGHRVAPQEIEDVLMEMGPVRAAAVCGVPHPMRGEALVASVVIADGVEVGIGELRKHCLARLPMHKVPAQFRIVTALPRTPNGKLDRRALAASIAS